MASRTNLLLRSLAVVRITDAVNSRTTGWHSVLDIRSLLLKRTNLNSFLHPSSLISDPCFEKDQPKQLSASLCGGFSNSLPQGIFLSILAFCQVKSCLRMNDGPYRMMSWQLNYWRVLTRNLVRVLRIELKITRF